jgi:hypothetical protein
MNSNTAGDQLYHQQTVDSKITTQTLSFRDGTEQWHAGINTSYDATRDVTYHEDVPLAEFFSRPIKVATYNWATSDASPFYQAFDPWTLFLTNNRVSNRMSNFQNFSGTLHVKFLVNGNSFNYGRIMCDYAPLSFYDNMSSFTVATDNLCQASQRLHLYIDPTVSQGGELELPFIWVYDKVNLTSAEYNRLGTIYMREMAALKHAGGAVSTVNISVFIWATDVKLSIPTINDISGIVPQAGSYDEYGMKPMSMMATAVASAAGKLGNIPMIGKYARATQMMAGAAASVASLFGFSRPAVIDNYVDMRAAPISRIANYNVSDNVAKLSLDAKQELSIDPSIVGFGAGDELAITSIASKESYLHQFLWTTAKVSGDPLWSARVGPVARVASGTYYIPAITYATLPFQYWRGSVTYRFQIVASGFHKGRLLVVWDPYAQTSAPETNVQYSKIVDLAEERDFTFEVGWGDNKTYLLTNALTTMQNYQAGAVYNTPSANYNGVVSVYVLNDLVTPSSVANNDIIVNVFISACDDWKVAAPFPNLYQDLAPTTANTPQSGTFEEVDETEKNAPRIEMAKEAISMCQPLVSDADSVYFGETITSLRQLMRRYSLWSSLYGVNVATAGIQQLRMPDFPPNRGYSVNGAVLKTANNFNPSKGTILNYLSYGFIAFRGGLRHKVLINGFPTNTNSVTTMVRDVNLPTYTAIYATGNADVITSQYAFATNRMLSQIQNSAQGGHVNSTQQQPNMEVEFPMYRSHRFAMTRNNGARANFSVDLASHTLTTTTPAGVLPIYDIYIAGAEDATFIGFQGCPPLIVAAS